MQFIQHTGPAASDLEMASGPMPELKSGEVMIKVSHFGVNRPDVFQRMGLYPPPPEASPILGLEVSGEIVALADDVDGWQIGDRVCALCNGGGYAQYCTAPAGQCLPIPKGLTMAEAASLPETFFTVWSNVFLDGQLKAGDVFLVHAGASGIGSAAIQMALGMGARVITTVSSKEKQLYCESLGAELVINYQQDDFVAKISAFTEGKGVDVILDMVGGDYVEKNITVAAIGGRIVSIAFLKGSKVNIDLQPVMVKRLCLRGSTLRPRTPDYKALLASQLLSNIWPLLEQKIIKPAVSLNLPWTEISEAHRAMEANQVIGKAVLEVV